MSSLAPASARARVRGEDPGFIRVCAWCNRIADGVEWVATEDFIRREARTPPSHGICRECLHTYLSR